ncbi:phosphotransferase family protein [Halomicrobium salinisoli]|uniref:phosphotransferase family protein n=1 Tax=Halomicrobium salinisoli TaxID=2878391 RepID=UPI001CF09F48|nr:phosphotransferase [Halomicrobium salinisoli]
MTDESMPAVADQAIRGMVRYLEPSWEVAAIERADHGTDSVALLEVETPAGDRSVVLKAATADHVSPERARTEPRLLTLVGRETGIPVPDVFGHCDDHEEYPAPFYLMARVDGENFENRADELSPRARERVFREAGEHLAELHDLGPLPRVGGVGVRDGELAVPEDGDHDGFHDWLLDSYEDTLDSLADGGYFPHLAEDRSRFADIVPDVRRYLRETVPELPDPGPPTYCNKDYRYGNLLLDPETGEAQAVLDWGNVMAAPPAFNLASTESLLLTPDVEGTDRTAELRDALRTAYADARDEWTFDEATEERLRVYRLACRLDAMACLPLWYPDRDEREQRAADHRRFVARYV